MFPCDRSVQATDVHKEFARNLEEVATGNMSDRSNGKKKDEHVKDTICR